MKLKIARFAAVLLTAGVLLLAVSTTVPAASVGVTPGQMAFSVRAGGTDEQTLYVINQGNTTSEFNVYIEGENGDWFIITPDTFTLGAQQTKDVEIKIAPPLTAGLKDYDVKICIISMSPDSDLHIGAGIKVLAHVQVTGLPIMSLPWWIASVSIGLAIVVAAVVWVLVRRRKKAKHA